MKRVAIVTFLMCMVLFLTPIMSSAEGVSASAEDVEHIQFSPPVYLEYSGLPEHVKVGDSGVITFQWPVVGNVQTEGEMTLYTSSKKPGEEVLRTGVSPVELENCGEPVLIIGDDMTWSAVSPGCFVFSQGYSFSDDTYQALKNAGIELLPQRVPNAYFIVTVEGAERNTFRLYNPNTGEHLYTLDDAEKSALLSVGWKDEGIAWTSPGEYASDSFAYRLFNPYSDEHIYTTDAVERHVLVENGWQDEGEKIPLDSDGTIPVYRLFNPAAKTNTHLFTTDAYEKDVLISQGWEYEGIAWSGN